MTASAVPAPTVAPVAAAHWRRMTEAPLDPATLAALLADEIPAIRIKGFATGAECSAFAHAVDAAGLAYYSVGRRIGYIGMAQYEYRWDKPKEAYFRDAPAARARIEAVFARSFDPIARLTGLLAETWPHPVGIAHEPGLGDYFAGIIRVASEGVDLHADFAPFNSPHYAVGTIDAQLGWNFFAEDLVAGGDTTIHHAPWSPAMIAGEIPKSYGLDRASVSGSESFTYAATAGDVVIFNTRNPHEIAGGTAAPGRNRISIGAFIGRMPDGALAMWS